jgi:Zn finger protein HypA/HybF involved in hydrogenase expression
MKIASIKIEADVYTWVTERAEHIRKNNPDMPEGQEYGIAWLQYKKKNPKWKSKKEKEKKAELLTGFFEGMDNENYLEVYKNPTSREIADTIKQDEYKSIRGVICNDGTIYCWPGMILHDQLNNYLDIAGVIPVNDVLRFSFDGTWIIDLHNKFTKEQGLELIRKNESILSKFGNVQADYFIYNSSDVSNSRFLDLSYDDIYEKVANNKQQKLIRKSELYDGSNLGYSVNGHDYLECFINPTYKEFEEAYKLYGIKGILLEDGTVYMWAGLVTHNDAISLFKLPNGLHFQCFGKDRLGVYLINGMDANTLKNALTNTTSLYNWCNKNTQLEYVDTKVYGAAPDKRYKKLKTITDILNLEDNTTTEIASAMSNRFRKIADEGGGMDAGVPISAPVSIPIDSPNSSLPPGGVTNNNVQYNVVENNPQENPYRMWYPTYDYRKKEPKRRKDKMKSRLKKLNELYDSFEDKLEGDYYEVFKNPTAAELSSIKSQDSKGSIRGIIQKDGTIYAWAADMSFNSASHMSNSVDTSGLRFKLSGSNFAADGGNIMDLYTITNLIRQNISAINSLTSTKKIELINVTDVSDEEDSILDLNKLMEPAVANLIKKRMQKMGAYIHCHNCGWDNGDFGYPGKDTIYKTEEEYENKNPDRKCPKCGAQELDID